MSIETLCQELKARGAKIIRLPEQEFPVLRSRLPMVWTTSNFVAMIGGAPLAVIQPYIERQKNV